MLTMHEKNRIGFQQKKQLDADDKWLLISYTSPSDMCPKIKLLRAGMIFCKGALVVIIFAVTSSKDNEEHLCCIHTCRGRSVLHF